MIKIAQQTFGGLDIVINSAGQMLSSKITDYQVDEWDSMIDVNIKGTLYTAQAALPTMLEQSSGHLINIASISGFEVTKVVRFIVRRKQQFTLLLKLEKSWQRQVLK